MESNINGLKFKPEYDQIFENTGFRPGEVLVNSEKTSHLIIIGKIDNIEVLFKSYGNSVSIKASNILHEGKVGNLLNNLYLNRGTKIPVFETIDFGKSKNFSWLIRKYYRGRILGLKQTDVTSPLFIDQFTYLNRYFVNNHQIIVKNICNNLYILNKIDIKTDVPNLLMNKRFVAHIEKSLQLKISSCIGEDLTRQMFLLDHGRDLLLSKKNLCATIGDLAPTNIFVDKNNDIRFFDLEWFGIDNQMVDITFLWLLLWRYPDWQNELIKIAINSKQDKQFFMINLIRIIVTLFDLVFDEKDIGLIKNQKSKIACKKHIWAKYLIASGKSFEALMEVKAEA